MESIESQVTQLTNTYDPLKDKDGATREQI